MNFQVKYLWSVVIVGGIFGAIVTSILLVRDYLLKIFDSKDFYKQVKELSDYAIIITFMLMLLFLFILIRFLAARQKQKGYLQALQSLYEENQRYFDNTAAGFLVVDEDRTIVNVNPKLCKMLGYEREQLIGKNALILHIDEEHYRVWGEEKFQQALYNSNVLVRYAIKHADGSQIWLDVSGSVLDKTKELPNGGVLWTAIEVSDEIRASKLLEEYNKQLRENIHYLKTLINTAPTPIFVKDDRFCYQECNDAFLELFGKTREQVIGKCDDEIFDSNIAEQLIEQDEELLHQYRQHYTLHLLIDTKKAVIEFYTAAIILRGSVNGFVGFCIDVTQKEERELYLNMRVEQEVMRNLELQKKYYQERLIDTKFSVIGKLAAGITHEINTPLTYVKGNIEILQITLESMVNEKSKKSLDNDFENILEGITRMEGIVASMREMSQQSGESKEVADISETIMTALTLSNNKAKHVSTIFVQGIPFEYGMQCSINKGNKVFIQKQRIEQVWVIILNNAIEELSLHGTYEKNKITIDCQKKADEIIVRFEDTGRGIDEEILDNIFDPFVSSKESGGIGVGLNIANRIVKDQKGSIRAYNGENGAVFEVALPLVRESKDL